MMSTERLTNVLGILTATLQLRRIIGSREYILLSNMAVTVMDGEEKLCSG
jgi:hypothetical protein